MLTKNSANLLVFLLYLMREASSLPEIDATHPLLYSVFGGDKKVGWGCSQSGAVEEFPSWKLWNNTE